MTGDRTLPQLTAPKLSTAEVTLFLADEFPQIAIGRAFKVEETRAMASRGCACASAITCLRPGGTISGPSMFALADIAMYAAVLASAGPIAHAVTTNLNINFLRKPGQRDMIGEARYPEARQAARGGRDCAALRWRGGASGPCDRDLFAARLKRTLSNSNRR